MENREYKEMLIKNILEWQTDQVFDKENLSGKSIKVLEAIHDNVGIVARDSICLEFTNTELYMLSDAIICLEKNISIARSTLPVSILLTNVNEELSNFIETLSTLNEKICTAIVEE